MITRFIITTLTIAVTLGANALFLNTDGVIKVKGGSWRDVKITVVPEFSAPFEIALTGAHFKLDLPLYSTYLLRAEHPGCAAKAILFDCTAPENLVDLDFEFPFEVELEVMSSQEEFEYAGPIGLVSFNELKTDFSYNTDYAKIHKVPSLPELERVMVSSRGSHRRIDPTEISVSVTKTDRQNLTQPMLSTAQMPKVESPNEQFSAMPEHQNTTDLQLVAYTEGEGSELQSELAFDASDPKRSLDYNPALDPRDQRTPTLIRIADKPELKSGSEWSKSEQCNTHQFIQEPRYVMIVDRIGTADGCVELRRVSHAYGAVYYFINGMAATSERYSNKLQQAQRSSNSDKIYVQN